MASSFKDDICWRKARLAARLILRARAARLSPRDQRLGAQFKRDPDVTERLIEQALASLSAKSPDAKV